MVVWRSGVWLAGRAELLKSFVGQEVLCLTENLCPPDASLRRKLHHHLTSLCLMMLFYVFYRGCCVWERHLSLFRAATPEKHRAAAKQREAKGCCQTQQVISVTLSFILIVKITLPDDGFVKKKNIFFFSQWNRLHLSPSGCAVGSHACESHDLRVLSVQELLLGRCNAAVPGAGAVRPLDAGVVVGLASVHLLLDHQVRPQTLLRGGDLTGQRGTAHDLWETHKAASLNCVHNLFYLQT